MQDARHGLSPVGTRVDGRLLRLVPADARRILVAGAGAAVYAAELRRARPTASFVILGPAGPDAPAWLRPVVEDGDMRDQAAGLDRFAPFDAILLDGALESNPSPEGFLKTLVASLAPAGVIAMKVANVHHWSRVGSLLTGAWDVDADPVGLSDERLRRALKEAGLESADWRKVQHEPPQDSPRATAILAALEASAPDGPGRKWARERIGITHFLVAATPVGALGRPLLVHQRALGPLNAGLNASVARVRLMNPGTLLEGFPGVRVRTDTGNQLPEPTVREPDRIFVWQRVLFRAPNVDALRKLHERGFVCVIEFDDHPNFFTFINDGGRATFLSGHAVQTSTPELADYIRQFNPEVMAFDNQLPSLDPLPEKPEGPVKVLFAAINRKAGWERIVQSFRDVLASGVDARAVVVGDKEFFQALGPIEKEFMPILDYDRYQDMLGGVDIALLPLADTEFDRAKTDLKFIECAARGTVVLASPVVYGKTVRDGETGFLYRSPEEFAARLRLLITDHGRRREMARAAYDYVREERMLSRYVRARLDWYRSLVARRDELHAAAMARVGVEATPAG